MKADGREARQAKARPKAARDKADTELFWLTVAVVCALLVGLRRSSPAIRAEASEWWDRWSTVVLLVAVLVVSASASALVLRARRRYRRRVADAAAEAAAIESAAMDAATVEQAPLPTTVEPFIELPPAGDGAVLRYAVAKGGDVQGWALDGPDAHCLVVGPPGSGKTNLLQVLAVEATRQGVEVVAADPKRVELIGLRDWPGVSWVATDVGQIAELLTAVHAEMERRFELIETRSARREQVRPGELRPILVVLDELAVLCSRLEADWEQRRRDTDARRHPALDLVAELATLARPAKVHLAVAVDRPDAAVLRPVIRDHLRHRVSLTPLSEPAAMIVWERPDVGVGLADVPGRATASGPCGPREVQCVKAPEFDQWSESASRLRPTRPLKPTLVQGLSGLGRDRLD